MSDNIKVAIRVRPLIKREIEDEKPILWNVENTTEIVQLEPPGLSFSFDRVFNTNEDNQTVYEDLCAPLVEAAMSGFNGTIFAYGQTSSGKTYTMSGKCGIIKNAVEHMFTAIDNMPERTFLIRVSYMEIYNEVLYDLTDSSRKGLKIKEDADGVINVVGLKEVEIKSSADVFQVLKIGERQRSIGETKFNEKSSRSHTIFRMIVESRSCNGDLDEDVCVAHLNLVDLAGSEKAAQHKSSGARFKEGVSINKSLLTLTTVIRQLSEGEHKYVSYRDSKLTRILQNSLGGNAHTVIICTVTPASNEYTVSTLKFADRAKNIKNKPVVNVVSTDRALLKKYDQEIRKLTVQLQELQKQNEPQVLQKLEETSKQNEHLKLQIKALNEKFLVSQLKDNHLPTISKSNRRETWCFGLNNRKRAPMEPSMSCLKPLPILREEETTPTHKSDLERLSTSVDFSDVSSPQKNKYCTSATQTEEPLPQEFEVLKKHTVEMEKELPLMSSRIHDLELELKELKEFTTLEKQFYIDDNRNFVIESLIAENKSLKESLEKIKDELALQKQSYANEVPVGNRSLLEQGVQVVPWLEVTPPTTMYNVASQTEEEKKSSAVAIEQAVQANLSCDVKEKHVQVDLKMVLEENGTSRSFKKLSLREQGVQVSLCAEVCASATLHDKCVQVEEVSSEQSVEANRVDCAGLSHKVPLQLLLDDVNKWKSSVVGCFEKVDNLPQVIEGFLAERDRMMEAVFSKQFESTANELLSAVQMLTDQRDKLESNCKELYDAFMKSREISEKWKEAAYKKREQFQNSKENDRQTKKFCTRISLLNEKIKQYKANEEKLFGQVEQMQHTFTKQIEQMFDSLRREIVALKKRSKQTWCGELEIVWGRINQQTTECGVQLRRAQETILQCSSQMAIDLEKANSSLLSIMSNQASAALTATNESNSLMNKKLEELEFKCVNLESENIELITQMARLKEHPNPALENERLKCEVQMVTEKYQELQSKYIEKEKQSRLAVLNQYLEIPILQHQGHENMSAHESEDMAKSTQKSELQLENGQLRKRLKELETENGVHLQKISFLKNELRKKQQDDDVTISIAHAEPKQVPNRAARQEENKENKPTTHRELHLSSTVPSASLRLSLDKDTSDCKQQ